MRVQNVTGTVILGFIAAIFGVDALLNGTGHPTISEAFNGWIREPENMVVYLTASVALTAHFWWFRK